MKSSSGHDGVKSSSGRGGVKSYSGRGGVKPRIVNSSSGLSGVKSLSIRAGCSWLSSSNERQPSSVLTSRGQGTRGRGLSLGKRRLGAARVKGPGEAEYFIRNG